jgi:dolichol-phosphate mannosyltransferase
VTSIALSILLPAYEEAENLDWLLPQISRVLGAAGIAHEIVVVDAPTPRDDTQDVCIRHAALYVPRTGGNLYGDAIRTGIRVAKGERLIVMDADGSHNPEFLPQLWASRNDADLVIASRYVIGGRTDNPRLLILLSLAVNLVFRIVLGLKCADVSNSFRLYRAEPVRGLTLECNNFDIVEELLVKLSYSKPGFTILEIPFTFEKRQAGKTKRKLIAFAFSYVATLWRLHTMKRRVRAAMLEGRK